MSQDLQQMTNAELKQYISEHRNDDEAFHAALTVLISRQDPNAPIYPPDLPMDQMEAILKAKIDELKQSE